MDAYFYITALGHIGAYAYKYGSLGTGRKWRVPRASSSELAHLSQLTGVKPAKCLI